MFLGGPTSKEFTEQNHIAQVLERSPMLRIELRLDPANRVDAVDIDWRERPKRKKN